MGQSRSSEPRLQGDLDALCPWEPGSLGGAAPRREEGWPAWFTHVWAGDHWWLNSGLRGRMLCPGQVPGLQVPSPLSPATADPSKTVCVCVCGGVLGEDGREEPAPLPRVISARWGTNHWDTVVARGRGPRRGHLGPGNAV